MIWLSSASRRPSSAARWYCARGFQERDVRAMRVGFLLDQSVVLGEDRQPSEYLGIGSQSRHARAAFVEEPGGARSATDDVDHGAGIQVQARRQRDRLRSRGEVHRTAQLVDDLHRLTVTWPLAHRLDGAHGGEYRSSAVDSVLRCTHQELQCAVGGAGHSSRHRRVDHGRAGGAEQLVGLAGGPATNGG